MLIEGRRQQIIDLVTKTDSRMVSISHLSQQLGVSEMTIRRDLDWLASRSLVTRIHGGAAVHQANPTEKSFEVRSKEYNSQKNSIGWAAAQIINDGDRIILDGGTTTQYIARHLENKQKLTVITNNLPVATELALNPQIETIVLGGILKHKEQCTVGGMVVRALASLSAGKLFLSATGFNLKNGATDPDMRETEVKQAMIRAADEIILAVDSSKYGNSALMQIAPLETIHKIITDDSMPLEAISALESLGIIVITPERLTSHFILGEEQ